MNALFVLVPAAASVEDLLATAPSGLRSALSHLRCRRYPRADDAEHLTSLVRAVRDPAATTWVAGTVRAIAAGAVLGGITNGILAGCFEMLGGLLEVAIPLGCAVGAFLGGFSATMRGTESPCPAVRSLLPHVRPRDQLVSWSGQDVDCLRHLRQWSDHRGLHSALRS